MHFCCSGSRAVAHVYYFHFHTNPRNQNFEHLHKMDTTEIMQEQHQHDHHQQQQQQQHQNDFSSTVENFQWLVLLISCAEEEIQYYLSIENNPKNGIREVDGNDELLKSLGDLLRILSISFSKLCSNRNYGDEEGDRRSYSFSYSFSARSLARSSKSKTIHALVMIRLFMASYDEYLRDNIISVGITALSALSCILEILADGPWIDDDELDPQSYEESESLWTQRADTAVSFFANMTNVVESGLASAVPVINEGFDCAGNLMKENIAPIPKEEQPKVPDHIVKSSEFAKSASVKAYDVSKGAFVGIGQVATKAVNVTANKIDNVSKNRNQVYNENRTVLNAGGRVALAGFGAFASISEALFDTSLASKYFFYTSCEVNAKNQTQRLFVIVVSKAADTSADVIGHRYGESTGKVVGNSADAVTNSVRSVKFATSLRKFGTHAESVARNNGKAELDCKKPLKFNYIDEKSTGDDSA